MSEIARHTHSILSMETEEREEQVREKALSYLRAKFPETEEQVFFTDYTGQTYGEVIQVWAVAQAADIDEICQKCKGEVCEIRERVKIRNSRPVVRVSKGARGYSYLDVRWIFGLACRYIELNEKTAEMLKKSGITWSWREKTFKSYESEESNVKMTEAKEEAIKASKAGTNLILAGQPGTGKTHLAVAIAIKAMKEGRRALFRLVSVMLDEVQTAIRDNGDYDGLMRQFKTVPCLVLDDLGHENMTAARASYLHQIIDYRYVHKLQTIITTNAKSVEELCEWDKEEYVMPIVSRILERGKWVSMENAEDYRKKRGAESGI